MVRPPISLPLIRDLKCAHCRKFVSCGPVHVAPDSSVLCGRCMRVAKRTYRNYAFEALASIFYFPCQYWPQHCNKKLEWNQSLKHERNCLYQSSCNVLCARPGTFFKSERKLPPTGGIDLVPVTDDALEILKCAVCELYLSNAPVYIVVDGKSVCHRCVHANGMPNESIRNLSYETIAEGIIFPCIYRFRGCTYGAKFGRHTWEHEHECPYAQQVAKSGFKKLSKTGKERGVIETHSGHVWGTITPHSALFAPPKTKNNDGKIITQELTEMMKKKHKEDEAKGYDSQSMDSVMSKSTFDSLGDNISRSTTDNISKDYISRSTGDNLSRDNISRTSSTDATVDSYRASALAQNSPQPRPSNYEWSKQQKMQRLHDDVANYLEEITPLPVPTGHKVPYNGHYHENMMLHGRPSNFEQYPHMHQYPQQFDPNQNLQYSASFNYRPGQRAPANPPKRSESLRVGNQEIIDELKARNLKKNTKKNDNPYEQCNSLQDIVQSYANVESSN